MKKNNMREKIKTAVERAAGRMDIEGWENNLEKAINYVEELQKWNKAYNLVGRRIGIEGILDLYVDALTPLSVRGLFDGRKEVLDAGSGAGMPGIPLYLMVGPFPLTLVESQRKKITFLRHVCRVLALDDVAVYPGRLEEIARDEDHLSAYDVGLARAVMEPLRLSRTIKPLLCKDGRTVIFVGKKDAERIKRSSLDLTEKGMQLEAIRSMQRIVGKENYLAVLRKTGR